MQILAVGQQIEGTGNVSAEIVSLVHVNGSNEVIVTINTNSTQRPEILTQILTQPLVAQLEEYSNIIQNVSFNVQNPDRHGKCKHFMNM